MENKIFNEYSIVPLSIAVFFIGLALLFGVDGYVSKEYYLKKGDAIIECVKQGMAYDSGDCVPYRKN